MTIGELLTPCLLLDESKFERNVARMRARMVERGGTLRFHVKTCKSIEATRRVLGDAPDSKIMVSTLEEARYFFSHGIRDMTYGVGITDRKLDEVAKLLRDGADLKVVLDSMELATRLARRGRELGVEFAAYIEVDTDGLRAGVDPEGPDLIDIGRTLRDGKGARLAGVLTHAGKSYLCTSIDLVRSMAEQERQRLLTAADRLRRAGIECPHTSLGSTPTALYGDSLEGVTEVRAGVYVFQDLVMAGIGVCGIEDIALSVLATVIGHQRSRNRVIVDAGWMALSRDRGTADQRVDQGYGLACDLHGAPFGDLIVASTSQEHGIVADPNGGKFAFEALPIGSLVRVLPNHACATAAQFDRYHLVDRERVSGVWMRTNHW